MKQAKKDARIAARREGERPDEDEVVETDVE